jgi:ATP-dependent Clp protease ATP-binding subunit ClpC
VLLGMLDEGRGLAAQALTSLDLSADGVRAEVHAQHPWLTGERFAGQVPFTPAAQAALERSSRESLGLAHTQIGTEHLLIGLIAENSGLAVRILDTFDIAPAMALAAVQRLVGTDGSIHPEPRGKGYARPRGRIGDWFSVPPSQPVRRLLVTAVGSADMADHGEIELDDLLGVLSSYTHADVLSEFGIDAADLHNAIERDRQHRSPEREPPRARTRTTEGRS